MSKPASSQTESASAQMQEVSRAQFLQLFGAVFLPMFLAAVDQTLLAAATPVIAAEFGDLQNSPWVATAYLMAGATMVTMYGRLGDRYGRRRVMLASLSIFALGALVCCLAPTLLWLIGGRVLQGLGGGGLMALSMAMVGDFLPPRKRAAFQGYFSALFTAAHVCGPMIGGAVVANLSWRWLFAAYLPLVAIAAWRISLLPRRAAHADAPGVRDAAGFVLFTIGITALLFGLSSAGLRFEWLSWQTFAFPAMAALAWWALYAHERRHPAPFFPIELLRIATVRGIALTTMSTAFVLLALLFYLPIYLQLAMQAGAGMAGVLLAPVMAGMVIGGIITGWLVSRTGHPQPLPVFGLSLACTALLLMALAPANIALVVSLGFFAGLGLGPSMPTSQLMVQSAAGPERLGAATALVSLSRTLGAAMGTALTGAVIYSMLPDIDVRALSAPTSADAHARIVSAFHTAFFMAAVVAALGAWNASRVPKQKL